nr:hydantoinase B/oxoprolinase family protein [Pseudoroseomonas ludipueritiae]
MNNPFNGRPRLPDVAVATPVFDAAWRAILFFLRGHHADIGGITSGATPAGGERCGRCVSTPRWNSPAPARRIPRTSSPRRR